MKFVPMFWLVRTLPNLRVLAPMVAALAFMLVWHPACAKPHHKYSQIANSSGSCANDKGASNSLGGSGQNVHHGQKQSASGTGAGSAKGATNGKTVGRGSRKSSAWADFLNALEKIGKLLFDSILLWLAVKKDRREVRGEDVEFVKLFLKFLEQNVDVSKRKEFDAMYEVFRAKERTTWRAANSDTMRWFRRAKRNNSQERANHAESDERRTG